MANSQNSNDDPEHSEGQGTPADGAESLSDPAAADADTKSDSIDTAASDEGGTAGADEDQATRMPDTGLIDALAATPLLSDGSSPQPEIKEADDVAELGENSDENPEEEQAEVEAEERRSFAGRVLTWLILLLVGAGAALWAAPRVAPNLPDGLGPVKAFLMPGEFRSRAQIAALEADVDNRLEGLTPGLDEAAVQGLVATQTDAVRAEFETRLQALADQVAASDGESIEGRVTQLETRLEGAVAALDGLTSGGAGLSAEDQEALGAFSATVDGLRAELAALADQQGALSQRIDDVEVAVDRRLTEAEVEVVTATEEAADTKSAALAVAAVSMIDAALASGEPFAEALGQLEANTDEPVPAGLTAVAETGVATLGVLRTGFADAAHQAIRANIRAEGQANPGSRLASFLEAQIATRSLTPKEGDSTDAVLSRAEDALRRDNLAAAVDELRGLSEVARSAMGSWLPRAEARMAAMADLTALQSAVN